jgi:prepilin-type N-terminal cleavage/methylation domain-containing protein
VRSKDRGFTLIEVLVTLVATGLLLAIVMNGALLARERAVRAAQSREAVLLARHLLAAKAVRPFAPGNAQGRDGDLSWSLDERPLATDPRGIWVLSRIGVAIMSANGATLFEGETRKLKRAAR